MSPILHRPRAALAAVGLLALGGGVAAATGSSGVRYATTPTSSGALNPAALPLGDGYVSHSPTLGSVDSCQTSFSSMGGAQEDGPWINASAHTWDYETKLRVSGAIKWPEGSYSVSVSGGRRVIRFNDLPVEDATGVFPIASSDPAYQYDRNPNRIEAHTYNWSLPLSPSAASAPHCANGGAIGVLDDGVLLYDALDGEGRDAGAHEVLDLCAGHPDMSETYHHHEIPPCVLDKTPNGKATLVGYALDGYGIYVVKNAKGVMPTNTALDACHGTTSRVPWNGHMTRTYHYVATLEYPYTIGCFHGTPISSGMGSSGASGAGGASGQGGATGLPPGGPPPGL